jgi:hypothetical protein
VVSWFLRPKTPPLWLGIVVAAGLIALETVFVYWVDQSAHENAYGAVFLLGVLVISAGWGFGLALSTTVVSAAVYTYFHMGPDGFNPATPEDWTAIVIFVPIALLANLLVGQARLRAAEADHRRREAVASREELRVLAEQQAALRRVATLVAEARSPSEVFAAVADELARRLGLPHAALVAFEPDGSSVLVAYFDDRPNGSASAMRWAMAASPKRSTAPDEPPGWIVKTSAVSRTSGPRRWVSAPSSAFLSSCTAVSGVPHSSDRRRTSRCQPTPRFASRTSPIWSRPQSPMRRPDPSSPRRGPGS